MSEQDQAAARKLAFDVIRDYRDRGCPEPGPIDAQALKRMMDWLVCADVPGEYVPMMLEEMELDGRDSRVTVFESSAEARAEFPVVVVGCGQSGLLAAIRMQEAGIPYTVIEKNPGVGGTWWENTYPGARVDVGNHFYCYSFEPDRPLDRVLRATTRAAGVLRKRHAPTRNHRPRQVLHRGAAAPSGMRRRRPGRYGSAPPTATKTRNAHRPRADQRSRPTQPALRSRHQRRGDLRRDPRFTPPAGITASTSPERMSYCSAPARAASRSRPPSQTRYAASPSFSGPRSGCSRIRTTTPRSAPACRWALRHLPFYGRWYRFLLFWPGCDTAFAAARVDPDWPDQQRAVSAANDMARIMFTEWITSQIDGDTELLAKVIPDYPATGKRTLQDNGSWLRTLTKDHVELVRDGVDHIEPDAVVATDGRRYPADVLVYATGFRVNDMISSFRVPRPRRHRPANGLGWRPAAYLGITVPNFPNFFCLYGPGTNLASGGSLIFHSECEVRYIMGCLDLLIRPARTSMEPRQDRYDDWYARSQAEMDTLVWSQPSIKHSFYKDAAGKVHGLSPVAARRLLERGRAHRTPTTSSSADTVKPGAVESGRSGTAPGYEEHRRPISPRVTHQPSAHRRPTSAPRAARPRSERSATTTSPRRAACRPAESTTEAVPVEPPRHHRGWLSGHVEHLLERHPHPDQQQRRDRAAALVSTDSRRTRRGAGRDHHVDVVEDRQHPRANPVLGGARPRRSGDPRTAAPSAHDRARSGLQRVAAAASSPCRRGRRAGIAEACSSPSRSTG